MQLIFQSYYTPQSPPHTSSEIFNNPGLAKIALHNFFVLYIVVAHYLNANFHKQS